MEKAVRLKEGNIGLVLDSYTDIFSSFDPRPYSEKSLSEDFLHECRKAARDKEHKFELILMVPKKKRNLSDESKIKNRLKHHFSRHFEENKKQINSIKRQGFFWIFIGLILMITGAIFYSYTGFLFNLLVVIVEPGSWFLFWEGLDKILIEARNKKEDFNFYRKMTEALVKFENY